MIRVERLAKTFRGPRNHPIRAVSDVSLSVSRGEIVGLLGPNGAGKTTIIKCICGIVIPDSGSVNFADRDLTGRAREVVPHVAAVLEGNRNIYWELTPEENIEFFAGLQGISRQQARSYGKEILAVLSLNDKADTPVRKLSLGMKQKVALACALARRTPMLLLDEPTLGLDVEISRELRDYLKDLARMDHGLLVSSHDMKLIQAIADRVVIISQGSIVAQATVSELLEVFRAQAYSISLRGPLDDEARSQIQRRLPAASYSQKDGTTQIDLQLTESASLYALFGILEAAGAEVQRIQERDPDLEEIFINVVRGSR